MELDDAYILLSDAIDSGHAAHAYLIVGDPRGDAAELADRVCTKLFGNRDLTAHPDIHRLRPELKSRVISVDAMREKIVDPLLETSFAGGWKAGIVYWADRLQSESANAFLKTLEEPTARTIFFLLTDQPEMLLPTIISRCQRVDLQTGSSRLPKEPWLGRLIEALSSSNLDSVLSHAAFAARLNNILADMKETAEDLVKDEIREQQTEAGEELVKKEIEALVSSRFREFRASFLFGVQSWFRDLMAIVCSGPEAPLVFEAHRATLVRLAKGLSRQAAFANLNEVDGLAHYFNCSMTEDGPVVRFANGVKYGVPS